MFVVIRIHIAMYCAPAHAGAVNNIPHIPKKLIFDYKCTHKQMVGTLNFCSNEFIDVEFNFEDEIHLKFGSNLLNSIQPRARGEKPTANGHYFYYFQNATKI